MLAVLPLLLAADDRGPTDPLAKFTDGAVICAKDDVALIGSGLAALPCDVRRGACWKYDGESSTGKARLLIIEGRTPLPLCFPSLSARPDIKDKPFKVDASVIADHFVPESELPPIKAGRISEYQERWPGLSLAQADSIWSGQVWVGMTIDQATESVGWLIHK